MAAEQSTVAAAAGQPLPPAAPTAIAPAPTVSPPPGRAPASERLGGEVLITRNQGLSLRDLATGKERSLVTPPSGSFVAFPAWSPDGRRFAYTIVTPFAGRVDGSVAEWGGDLYLADANGSDQRLLLKHDTPGAQEQALSWTPDGAALIFTYLAFTYDRQGQFTGQVEQALRLNLADGAVTVLVDQATDTDLCGDGSRLTYVHVDPQTNSRATIVVAGVDGKNGHAILAVSEQIQNFTYPRFSPDCARIVFAANGAAGCRPTASGPIVAAVPALPGAVRSLSPSAHGLPYELWSINVDGSGLMQLTHFGEDEPYPAWSPDGRALLVLGARALYRMAADGSGVAAVSSGATLGQLSWR